MSRWKIGCLGLVILIAIGVLVLNDIVGNAGGDVAIDGIKCGDMAVNGYHVHAHLSMFYRGRPVSLHDGIGRSQYGLCYYALHTHDASGVIHIEVRDTFSPTLGNFFDIWHEPLSPRQFWKFRAQRGETMRVYVGMRRYAGNPGEITLRRHSTVTLEIGPPFAAPKSYNFGQP